MYRMFYVNDEPDGKVLYIETIMVYCIVNINKHSDALLWSPLLSVFRENE